MSGNAELPAVDSAYRVGFEGGFRVDRAPTAPPDNAPGKAQRIDHLRDCVERIDALQRVLYADDRHSLLLIFQAMDAAGKDGTIRAVLTGVDPAGCRVSAFRQPSERELEHDFLWRHILELPERGRIGVFNRSWYEEVLAVRVHPEYLRSQRLPQVPERLDALWQQRYASINDFERHLARNGTRILKFWLNVSREEQRQRLLARLEEPDKNWKFDAGDLGERAHWDAYMSAYEDALNATSTPWAPWYAIPADSKSYLRWQVADIVMRALDGLGLEYPAPEATLRERMEHYRQLLAAPD